MRISIVLAAIAAIITPAQAEDCQFEPWRSYQGTELWRTADGKAYLWVTTRTAIDADGSPRAYHPDDVGRPCASSGAGLDCPANAGYPTESWWPSVLVKDAGTGKAFVQTSGVGAGFFVSKTALFARSNRNEQDPARYVDASSVPYLVFPGPFAQAEGTGRLGDVGIAYHLGNDRQTPFLVADIGPNEPLGEASIALFRALGGNNPDPRNGSGVASGPTLYVLFPHSVRERPQRWPVSDEELRAEADRLLASIGGEPTLEACVERFR